MYIQKMYQATPRERKSEKLTAPERKLFEKFVNSFDTQLDAAAALEVTRLTLYNVRTKGSGRPSTIEKIRKAIA